jgi:hypothetical protein
VISGRTGPSGLPPATPVTDPHRDLTSIKPDAHIARGQRVAGHLAARPRSDRHGQRQSTGSWHRIDDITCIVPTHHDLRGIAGDWLNRHLPEQATNLDL